MLEGDVPIQQQVAFPLMNAEIAEAIAWQLFAAKCFNLASFMVLIYDHAITFSDEVEKIWKASLSGASILFILNRYITLFEFAIMLVAIHDPWSPEVCWRFFRFPGALTLVSVTFAALIMILRTYALYGGNNYVLSGLLFCLAVQITLMGYIMKDGMPAPLPKGLVGCILVPTNHIAAAFWLAPLATDTIIFILTVFKSIQFLQSFMFSSLLATVLRDGVMYFIVILAVNTSNVLILYLAPPGLKAFGASFSQIMTTIMVSRLQLNLRGKGVCLRSTTASSSFQPTYDLQLPSPSNENESPFESAPHPSFGDSNSPSSSRRYRLSKLTLGGSSTMTSRGSDVTRVAEEQRTSVHKRSCFTLLKMGLSRGHRDVDHVSFYERTIGNLGESFEDAWPSNSDDEKDKLSSSWYYQTTPVVGRQVDNRDEFPGRRRFSQIPHIPNEVDVEEGYELKDYGEQHGMIVQMESLDSGVRDPLESGVGQQIMQTASPPSTKRTVKLSKLRDG